MTHNFSAFQVAGFEDEKECKAIMSIKRHFLRFLDRKKRLEGRLQYL